MRAGTCSTDPERVRTYTPARRLDTLIVYRTRTRASPPRAAAGTPYACSDTGTPPHRPGSSEGAAARISAATLYSIHNLSKERSHANQQLQRGFSCSTRERHRDFDGPAGTPRPAVQRAFRHQPRRAPRRRCCKRRRWEAQRSLHVSQVSRYAYASAPYWVDRLRQCCS